MHPQPWPYLPGLSPGGAEMTARAPGPAAVHAPLGRADILEQLQMAVVVADRGSNLLYANAFAATLFGLPDAPARLVGRSLVSLGLEEGDARRVSDLVAQVLHGRDWEGSFASQQLDGSRVYVRARAVPLRLPSGEISGVGIMARDATRRGGRSERDRLRLLERIGERLAGSLELDVTLRQGAGTLALPGLTERDEPHYGADDSDFLSLIGSRVAIAIDNAMLFEEERRTALAFQTSLLQRDPPAVDGLEVAYKYVPAKPLETHGQGIQTQVGGDWYDIIPLSAGRVGIGIGDVEGRGARAAPMMGQLRAALRAFAQDDKPPAEILRRLDDWCRTLEPTYAEAHGFAAADPPTVSCTYLVYDAWSRALSFANAGHDAPLLITDHEVGQMEIEHKGLLLGVRGKGIPGLPTYREETRYLAPGSALVLYTDGLTDRRQRADGGGHYTEAEALQMLCEAVQEVATESVEAIAQAAEQAVPGENDDDMANVD